MSDQLINASPERQIRPFADVLQELNQGSTHEELSVSLNELVQAVGLLGKPGTLTFTIKVKSAGRAGSGTVMIADEVKLKIPEGDRPDSVFFVDRQGNLTRHPPGQERLPLREVPGAVVIDPPVDEQTGEIIGR